MADAAVGEKVEQVGINGVPRKRAQRQGRDELRSRWSEQCLYVGTLGAQRTNDLGRFVGSDGASDAEDNEASR